jgi:transcriptional regulator with XRE-family HTH domain
MILPDIDTFYLQLSELIKTERIKRKITQEQLRNVLSLSRGSITNLEKGRHRPSIYQLLQIASLFEIDYTKLIPISREKSKVGTDDSNLLNKAVFDDGDISKSAEISIEKFLSELKGGQKNE